MRRVMGFNGGELTVMTLPLALGRPGSLSMIQQTQALKTGNEAVLDIIDCPVRVYAFR